ncbi:MAG: PepSY domain-containing protein [Cyclobacteriaceae bacterium]|nr:PepSY domain-containing protein [Cyclobacteriaceae bacterium]
METTGLTKSTRLYRKIHKWIGTLLFVFFFFISVTGLLLGWKKHSGGLILPKTEKGTSTNLKDWLPYDSLHTIAVNTLSSKVDPNLSSELDRIDARPDKGSVKFVFKNHYTEIQLDCTTGNVLAINTRVSDILEQIHDGSILDNFLKTSDGQIKLTYTTLAGLGLLTLTVTGFFLWFNPVRIRRRKGI